jgi:ABC-type multidrug transport system ATPase subunit
MAHPREEPSLTPPRAASPGGRASAAGADALADGAADPTAISARSLTKTFRAGVSGCSARVDALRGATVDVMAGEVLGVVGPVGAGKSTLLLCLAGLLRPDAGDIAWFGRTADECGGPPGIAYVSHRPTPYAYLSVREAVEYHSTLRGLPANERGAAVAGVLDEAGLAAESATAVAELTRSASARLALAQAMVGRPRIVLLDDTLWGLEPVARRETAAIIRGMRARGLTVVIAVDELDAIASIVSRVVVMIDGRIAASGAPDALRLSRTLELTVTTPAMARRIFGARVAEVSQDRHVLRLPLDDTSAEAILARCRACGIGVERSRIVVSDIADDAGDGSPLRPR